MLRNRPPSDQEIHQLIFDCVNVGDPHQIGAGVSNYYDVPRNIQPPTWVKTVVWSQTVRISTREDRVVVHQRMLRIQREVGKSVPLEPEREPFSQVEIVRPDWHGGIVYAADHGEKYSSRATTGYRVEQGSNVTTEFVLRHSED